METIKVLAIEDNEGDFRLIKEMLGKNTDVIFITDHSTTLAEGKLKVKHNDYQVILLDLNLPDSLGIRTFEAINEVDVPIVILTIIHDIDIAKCTVRAGAQDYLDKATITDVALSRCILYAIERHARMKEELANIKKIKDYLLSISCNLDSVLKNEI